MGWEEAALPPAQVGNLCHQGWGMAAQGLGLRPPKDGKGGRGGSSNMTSGVQVGRVRWLGWMPAVSGVGAARDGKDRHMGRTRDRKGGRMRRFKVLPWLVASSAAVLCVALCGPSHAFGLPKIGDVKVPSLPKAEEKAAPEEQPAQEETKAPPFTGPKKRLAVMDLEVKIIATDSMEPTTTGGIVSTTSVSIPPPSDFGSGLTEMLTI